MILTDIDFKKIFDNHQNYVDRLQNPIDNKSVDFIKIVETSGCHQLVKLMLEYEANYDT